MIRVTRDRKLRDRITTFSPCPLKEIKRLPPKVALTSRVVDVCLDLLLDEFLGAHGLRMVIGFTVTRLTWSHVGKAVSQKSLVRPGN